MVKSIYNTMLNHFTSKAWIVVFTYQNLEDIRISVLGVFNTEKRADKYCKEQQKDSSGSISVHEIDVAPVASCAELSTVFTTIYEPVYSSILYNPAI